MDKVNHILDNEIFVEKLEAVLLQKLKENPNNVSNLIQLAETNRKKGNLSAANTYYDKVLLIEQSNIEALRAIAVLNGNSTSNNVTLETPVISPFYIISDFLPEDKLIEIDAIIEKNSDFFEASKVQSNGDVEDKSQRKSRVLHQNHFVEFAEYFQSKLRHVIPEVMEKLNIDFPKIKKPELALTMHLDGDFFKVHMDILPTGPGSLRKLTYVFYYHRIPKGFEGGDLLLFDSSENGKFNLKYTKVSPVRNSILFFPSHCFHKVTPIKLLSENYLNGRYTINGWFHA